MRLSSNYTEDDIQVLDDIAHIRLRTGHYIGETNDPRVLLKEAIDNASDESLSGHASEIIVKVNTKDNTYSVKDNGRGVPHGVKKLPDGRTLPTMQVLCTKSFSGGKFSNKNYKASCFTGDTKIKLADGRDITFEELLKEYNDGKENYCYSLDRESQKVIIEKINHVQITKHVDKLAVITLDNGEVIKSTLDHKFLTRDDKFVKAEDLVVGMSLMPGYFRESKAEWLNPGYLEIQNPYNSSWRLCHYLADDYNIRYDLYDYPMRNPDDLNKKRFIRHHIDKNKLNNNPTNIRKVTLREHASCHNLTEYNKSEKGRETSRRIGNTIGKQNLMNYVYSEANSIDKRNRMTAMNKDPEIQKKQKAWLHTPEGLAILARKNAKINSDPEIQKRQRLGKGLKLLHRMINEGYELTSDSYQNYKLDNHIIGGYPGWSKLLSYMPEGSTDEDLVLAAKNYNHSIVNIEFIDVESTPMYDLSVTESSPIFLLSAGVFVHNSGLHGEGATCINALSDKFTWISARDGEVATLVTSKGNVLSYTEESTDKNDHYTIAEFHADKEIFDSLVVPIDFIKYRCKINNAFKYNTKLYIDGVEQTDVYTNNIMGVIPDEKEGAAIYDEVEFSGETDIGTFLVGLRYTSETNYKCYPYANLTYNYDQGTHSRLLYRAICDAWSEFYHEADEDLKYDDCTLGLRSVISVTLDPLDLAFSSQTKEKLTTKNAVIQPLVDQFKEQFIKYLKNHKDLRTALLKRFSNYRASKNKLSSQKEIMNLVKVSRKTKSTNKVHRKAPVRGLIECTSNEFHKSELFLLEGDSAAGPLYRSRDPKYQAILPLRGKIKNVTYMDPKDALKSPDVLKVVNSVGAGILDDCDPDRCRYEKIMLLCFTGDTKVKLLDGTIKTFEELVELESKNPGRDYWVYSSDSQGRMVPGRGYNPRITGYTNKLAYVTLDDGSEFKCTVDHRFMMRDGSYKDAKDLVEGDSLMPLYTKITTKDDHFFPDREVYYNPINNKWEMVHKRVYEVTNPGIDAYEEGYHIHHINENRMDNSPNNLAKLPASDHLSLHMTNYNKSDEHRKRISELHRTTDIYKKSQFGSNGWNGSDAQKKFLKEFKNSPEEKEKASIRMKETMSDPKNREAARQRIKTLNQSEKMIKLRSEQGKSVEWQRITKRGKVISTIGYLIHNNLSITQFNYDNYKRPGTISWYRISELFSSVEEAIELARKRVDEFDYSNWVTLLERSKSSQNKRIRTTIAKAISKLIYNNLEFNKDNYNKIKTRQAPRYENIPEFYESYKEAFTAGKNYNHKVKSVVIVDLDEDIPVYCMSVEDHHNFLVVDKDDHSGIISHNCDSDSDAFQIRNLFFNVFVQLMPALVKAGMIYVIEAPLFSYIDPETKEKKYTNDFNDIPVVLKKSKGFTRYKGLGEMDDDEFYSTVLTKGNRKIYRLSYPDDIDKFNRIMGTSEGKRELLEGEKVIQYRRVNA